MESALPEETRSCLSFSGQREDHSSTWPHPHGSVAEQHLARWSSGLAPGVGSQGLLQGNLQSSASRAHLGRVSTAAEGSAFGSPGSYGLSCWVLMMDTGSTTALLQMLLCPCDLATCTAFFQARAEFSNNCLLEACCKPYCSHCLPEIISIWPILFPSSHLSPLLGFSGNHSQDVFLKHT